MLRKGMGPAFVACVMMALTSCGGGSSSPTAPSATSSTTGSAGSASPGTQGAVAYVQDIKPILDSSCTSCHNTRTRDGGVDLSTYSSVMRVVQPGSASSLLVRVTQPGGSMYSRLAGDRAARSALIRSWVVDNNAVENR